ncbi:MAG TPA: DUF448 domain-containing protein [Eubacteriaceae bacterium]|nr:DUF448 domain-containing protein [Eubacteriaceae bacterium]
MKKKPQRTCIHCGEKIEKRSLNRIVKNKEGEIFYDKTGKANGRGSYLCSEEKCIRSILEKNTLERVFRVSIDEKTKQEIMEAILNEKK